MSLVHCSGPEATETRTNDMGAEGDRPSWREARNDENATTRREREAQLEARREMLADPALLVALDYRGPR